MNTGMAQQVSKSPQHQRDTGDNAITQSPSYWKHNLLLLQENAPKPRAIICRKPWPLRPPQYGREYHGPLTREEADHLLGNAGDGSYLVRESKREQDSYTLCILFDGVTKNYKLFFDQQTFKHFVGEKKFDTIEDLVTDGLIHMHVEKHAADYIRRMADETVYEESPYSQYQKRIAASQRNRQQQQPNGVARDHSIRRERSSGQPSPATSEQELIPPKSHVFKVHTFRTGGSWCDYCRNFMWGLINQGMKCQDCGFSAHHRCTEKAQQDCLPDLRYVRRVFGVDLTTLCMAHNVPVPQVVCKCVSEVERRGLRVEGIYRVPGYHEDIEMLRVAFDTKGDVNLAAADDINCVAGLLKLYFRLLPLPLITYSVHAALTESQSRATTEPERVDSAQRILHDLPQAHHSTLKYLLSHLRSVAEHSSENRMSEENLARIFAPTLFQAPCLTTTAFHTQMQHLALANAAHEQEHRLLQFLMRHWTVLFA